MSREVEVFEALFASSRARESMVLCTVVRTAGSTPRKHATRMLIRKVAGHIDQVGTIGGGRVERQVLLRAAELLALGQKPSASASVITWTHELAMCCGGEMEILLENPCFPMNW